MERPRLAIITARGGSKRIPNKNVKEFCGKPILAYSIEAALKSKLFDEVMVSTDSMEIAKIAQEYGASVPFMRSEKTSNDYATTTDVLREVCKEYKNRGKEFGIAVCIYPTAPFVTAQKLIEAVKVMEAGDGTADVVTPVVRFSFPPQRAFAIKDEHLEFQYPEMSRMRSQDLTPLYHDAGQFYVVWWDKMVNGIPIKKRLPYILPESEVQDIDNEEDWKIAEIKYRKMKNLI